jgi:hypothetical protein
MVKRHDDLAERWGDGKVDWRTACEEFVELGLTDTRGRAVTERNARETWLQARKHVAAKRGKAAAQPTPRINPSRLPKEWRPANAPPPDQAVIAAPSANNCVSPQNQIAPIRKEGGHKKPYDPDEQMAHLFRTFKQRSGRE